MSKEVTVRDDGRKRVQTINDEPSMTVQSDRDQADIKKVLAKYEQTGVLVNLRDVDLEYRDVTQFDDFADLMRQQKEAEAAFMRLPSKVRELFHHDVSEWLDAAHDQEKLEALRPELEELGIWEPVADDMSAEGSSEPSTDDEPSGSGESE